MNTISTWLREKGASDPAAASGAFQSRTKNGNGRFTRGQVRTEEGLLEEVRLDESSNGQTFTTQITLTSYGPKVCVYATLGVTNTVSRIAPINIDPKCPAVIRKLLELYSDWEISGNPISAAKPAALIGETGAKTLAAEIQSESRKIPLMVVSQNEGETIWPRLAEELAFDLAGLSRVILIDEAVSWALSPIIGKINSCYRGAVRLYWPVKVGDTRVPSTVWTASKLLSNDFDGNGFLRFRTTARRTVMSTASLTIVPPPGIRAIRDSYASSRLRELESQHTSTSAELEIARSYLTDNQQLKSELTGLKESLAQMTSRAESAEYALEQAKISGTGSAEAEEISDDDATPIAGEIRFYKKTHSKPGYDVFVKVNDCGHAAWQPATKADKAKKGLERITGGNNWKNLQHCGTCTGGGMWKVRW